jgi:ketosteroid isomerase-like protein
MSFGKKLRGIFFDVEEEEQAEEIKSEEEDIEVKEVKKDEKPAVVSTPVPTVDSSEVKDEANMEIFRSFSEILEKANLEGFDYIEFAQILEKFKNDMPVEKTRFQAAFASGSVMGATKDKLIETAQHYLDVLEEEAKKFEQFYQDQFKTTVTDKEESVVSMDESIHEKRDQIEALEQEINEISNAKTEVNNEIIENKVKAEKVKNDFVTTLNIFVSRINNDIEKIRKYITE